jgi:hypothetical protein
MAGRNELSQTNSMLMHKEGSRELQIMWEKEEHGHAYLLPGTYHHEPELLLRRHSQGPCLERYNNCWTAWKKWSARTNQSPTIFVRIVMQRNIDCFQDPWRLQNYAIKSVGIQMIIFHLTWNHEATLMPRTLQFKPSDWIMWMRHLNNKSYLSYDKCFASISDRRKWTPTCKYAFPLQHIWCASQLSTKWQYPAKVKRQSETEKSNIICFCPSQCDPDKNTSSWPLLQVIADD